MLNILVVYCYYEYPMRLAIRDHLYSFREHSKHRCFYLNLLIQKIPKYIKFIKFDLIIFHTIFLSSRWDRNLFENIMKKSIYLKTLNCLKIALPQDEFINTDLLSKFIDDFKIDHVFSVAPESEWEKIYYPLYNKKVKFHNILTGYISDLTIKKINKISKNKINKEIDIFYRAWKAAYWLGRHGVLKQKIAEVFSQKAPEYGLKTDISTENKDTILGDDWLKYLLKSKYTIGVEGGASILDKDGSIKEKTEYYQKEHPFASFDEVEKNCFPGKDNSLNLFAISPRHFEACATKTCQVLIEGNYNNILKPWIHYIPLKKDFSNINDILCIIRDDKSREKIVVNAYNDIILSCKYSYKKFVKDIINLSFYKKSYKKRNKRNTDRYIYWYNILENKITWIKIFFYIKIHYFIKNLLPEKLYRCYYIKIKNIIINK